MLGELSDYDVLSVIGSGSFGTCYKVERKKDKKVYVWKAIDYGSLSEEKKELLVSEVNLLRSVRHPNVVRYYGHIVHKPGTTLYVVMEFCANRDLAALVHTCRRDRTSIQEGYVWRLIYQLASALRTLQSQGILHRDVKPANIFLDTEYNAKLGDFGLAKLARGEVSSGEEEDGRPDLRAHSFVGTPGYMSPEMIRGESYDGKSDVWSLGCVAYEMCELRGPFAGRNMKQLRRHISAGRIESISSQYSSDLRRLIDFMLTVNTSTRPDVRAILHHPSVVDHLPRCQDTPPFTPQPPAPPKETTKNLCERETLLRMRELALEQKEKKIQHLTNKLKQLKPKPNLDLDSSAGLGDDSPLFRPTMAKLNPALIIRPVNFPGPPRKVRFNDKKKKDEVKYTWYEIEPHLKYEDHLKRPLSDVGQILAPPCRLPSKPLSDGGADPAKGTRGQYTPRDLELAVAASFARNKTKATIMPDKENNPAKPTVKHTML